MKIAILGTRGIPNNYGGFEQFAEYISVGLAERGHDVTVYSPSFHPYKDKLYKGVKIKYIYSPEEWMGGSVGSFFYDFSCLKDALKNENFDIIYEAGYTSVIPAYIWFDIKNLRSSVVVTNMDGLEYKRTKFNPLVQKFVFWEEKMAVRHSHHLIADNLGIYDYYKERYGKDSKFLAYGANVITEYDEHILDEFHLRKYNYYLVIARLEPENNIEMVIQGYIDAGIADKPLIIVGKTNTPHAKQLMKKYGNDKNIVFQGGIYDFHKLNSIRCFSSLYFHGHSVGGTNPSLLEAMASKAFIAANNNPFNQSVLKSNALYFDSAVDVTKLLNNFDQYDQLKSEFIDNNLRVIANEYAWDKLVDAHEDYFKLLLS
ncbi:DUF1972 domain-containing protein [Sphingobacterium multivorum]|uniref:DUF1972 domain-containing protein n=1 Tax=Sphingobacterium multivorum TaxID=28454 RepID=UPI000E8FF844|nr:DUF1972 domain-containing protein [Sphingobacterium multivorum]HBX61882.1 glycosyl transferase [Flavobacteriaceae bacterium]